VLLNDVISENKKLQAEAKAPERKLCDMDERNNFLENSVNNLKHYHRSWSHDVRGKAVGGLANLQG
jgi:hypothetical protein